MHHRDRAVGAVVGQQFGNDALDVVDPQVDGHGGAMGREAGELFAGRHAGLVRVAGEDHALGDIGQGQLRSQQCGAGGGGGDSGDDLESNPQLPQATDLLADGAVQARVAGVHPGYIQTLGMGFADDLDDLFQMQLGAVDHPYRVMPLEHRLGHQGAGIDDHRAAMDQALALDGDQFRVAGAGTDEVDSHGSVL